MARILVTGSRGTLGKLLVGELTRRGHEVWGVDLQHAAGDRYFRADVGNFRELEKVFEWSYDYVYHMAAEFGRNNGEDHYETLWRTNAIGTRHILEWQRRRGFKLIFASSSEIYGETDLPFLTEDAPDIFPLRQPNDYAITKWVNELQIQNAAARWGTESVRVRLFNAYGPGELYHAYRSVVCLFCYNALRGRAWQVFENYHRVFMYVDDLIPTLANVADRFRAGVVVNIGGREYRSVRALSDLVLKATGADPALAQYVAEDKHNVRNKAPTIALAESWLGHDPKVPLEEGIPRTLEWMRREYGF